MVKLGPCEELQQRPEPWKRRRNAWQQDGRRWRDITQNVADLRQMLDPAALVEKTLGQSQDDLVAAAQERAELTTFIKDTRDCVDNVLNSSAAQFAATEADVRNVYAKVGETLGLIEGMLPATSTDATATWRTVSATRRRQRTG